MWQYNQWHTWQYPLFSTLIYVTKLLNLFDQFLSFNLLGKILLLHIHSFNSACMVMYGTNHMQSCAKRLLRLPTYIHKFYVIFWHSWVYFQCKNRNDAPCLSLQNTHLANIFELSISAKKFSEHFPGMQPTYAQLLTAVTICYTPSQWSRAVNEPFQFLQKTHSAPFLKFQSMQMKLNTTEPP